MDESKRNGGSVQQALSRLQPRSPTETRRGDRMIVECLRAGFDGIIEASIPRRHHRPCSSSWPMQRQPTTSLHRLPVGRQTSEVRLRRARSTKGMQAVMMTRQDLMGRRHGGREIVYGSRQVRLTASCEVDVDYGDGTAGFVSQGRSRKSTGQSVYHRREEQTSQARSRTSSKDRTSIDCQS